LGHSRLLRAQAAQRLKKTLADEAHMHQATKSRPRPAWRLVAEEAVLGLAVVAWATTMEVTFTVAPWPVPVFTAPKDVVI